MSLSWPDVWQFRGVLYSSLGHYILEPIEKLDQTILTPKFWRNFPLEPSNDKLSSALERLMTTTSILESFSKKEIKEKIMFEYTDLFIGSGFPKAAPIQSFYTSDKKQLFGSTTFEMRNILEKNGLETTMKDKFPEDHLGFQLLFLAKLSHRLNEIPEEKYLSLIRDQALFIGKYLLTWIPQLCHDTKKHGTLGFYSGLVELIWGTLLWDKKLLEEFITQHKSTQTP